MIDFNLKREFPWIVFACKCLTTKIQTMFVVIDKVCFNNSIQKFLQIVIPVDQVEKLQKLVSSDGRFKNLREALKKLVLCNVFSTYDFMCKVFASACVCVCLLSCRCSCVLACVPTSVMCTCVELSIYLLCLCHSLYCIHLNCPSIYVSNVSI